MRFFAFTLDLEAEYAGFVDEFRLLEDPKRIIGLLDTIIKNGIKITVFVTGRTFHEYPEIIDIFTGYGCELELHSYSHDLKCPDSEEEIIKGKKAYFDYLARYPLGYRAPQGRISADGIRCLEKNGFLYDSSIFPSYYPNPFKYLFRPRRIYYHRDSDVMEIPFTSITPLRLTFSISYIKLLGFDFFKLLLKIFRLPDMICFDSHLHDFLISEESFRKLNVFWRMIYSRNKYKGLDYFLKTIVLLKKLGYSSCYLSEVYRYYKERIPKI